MSSSKQPAEGDRWLRLARRYLRFGTRSRAQLRRYLTTRNVPEPVMERLLAICAREGLVDDRAGARLWAATLADRGYAQAAIRHQLSERGFDDTAIDQALNALHRHGDDEERARLAAAAAWQRASGSPIQRRASVARRLARRGFDSDLIGRLLADDPSTRPSA